MLDGVLVLERVCVEVCVSVCVHEGVFEDVTVNEGVLELERVLDCVPVRDDVRVPVLERVTV